MGAGKILILDDEDKWIVQHKGWLELQGISSEFVCTNDGREAIEFMIDDRSIKIAIIDEILLEKDNQGTQPFQGVDVRDEVRKQRDDIAFIVISSKPKKETDKWKDNLDRAFAEAFMIVDDIRREKQVIDFFHKYNFEMPPKSEAEVKQEYQLLSETIDKILHPSKPSVNSTHASHSVEVPGIYLGIGVPLEWLRTLQEEAGTKPRKLESLRHLFKQNKERYPKETMVDATIRRFRQQLDQKCETQTTFTKLEKKILWLAPGSTLSKAKEIKIKGKRKMRSAIAEKTRPFNILEWLAWQAELREDCSINAEQFLFEICHKPRPASGLGRQAVAQFKQEQGQFGVQMEILNREDRKRLTVEISRLSTQLVEANIGFASNQQVFRCDEGTTTYTALFKTGIILYGIDDPASSQ